MQFLFRIIFHNMLLCIIDFKFKTGITVTHGLRLTVLETNLYHLNKICYRNLTSDCDVYNNKIEKLAE